MSAKILAVTVVAFSCMAVRAQDSAPRFTVDTASRLNPGCSLIGLADGKLLIETNGERVTLTDLVEIRQDGRKLPALWPDAFVSLSNGDRLPLDADVAGQLTAGRLHLEPAASLGVKQFDLFAPNVVLMFWSLPDGVDDRDRYFTELQEESRKRDVVYLKNGDRIEGTIASFNAKDGCVVTTERRKVQTPLSKLAGIAWNTERQARLRTKKTYTRAILDGGARVNFLDLRFDEKSRRWIGKTQFGATLDVPETRLLGLDVRQGPAVDLSELTTSKYEHRPYLGATWPLVKDAAATGLPLRLAGSAYEKGLGMHAACQVAFKLDGQYQRFDALVGIDEPSRRGRAKIAIDVDGKRIDLNDGKEITIETAPIPVRLDLAKARTLTLIVELGSYGDVQANVSWAKARLIKK